ncbi:MAG: hypothetical protein RLZZ618_1426, partial [Pseudomonadota bacterium]
GFTLKTRYATGWNGSLVVSNYRIVEDVARQANLPQNRSDGGPGSVTRRDGTGWNTAELQTTYTPSEGDFTGGRHTLAFGLHRNRYVLDSPTRTAADWQRSEDTLTQQYAGRTQVTALYAQDAWKLRDDLSLTLGLRHERFDAFNGSQYGRFMLAACPATLPPGSVCTDNGTVPPSVTLVRNPVYGDRTLSATSPKASLAWRLADDLVLKGSYGRGVRFPNVEELYNGTVTATSETLSDPDLKAERSDAFEFGAEKDWDHHRLRVSLFHDDVRDAIYRQTDITVTPTVTRVSNVDRVRTRGIEFVWMAQDLLARGLSVDANLAFTRSKIVSNARDPGSEGMNWLRVPKVRANLLVAYRPDDLWRGSVGVRHSGRAYNDVRNADVNPNVYGGVSSFTFVDMRLARKITDQLELSLGVDNVADSRGYQAHPYPGRTVFTELRGTY